MSQQMVYLSYVSSCYYFQCFSLGGGSWTKTELHPNAAWITDALVVSDSTGQYLAAAQWYDNQHDIGHIYISSKGFIVLL